MPGTYVRTFVAKPAGHCILQPASVDEETTVADVIELLEHDHREVEQMFAEFEKATSKQEKETLRDRIIIELVRHSEAEEQAVYPVIRKHIDNGDTIIEHEIDEHTKAERIMKELDTMTADDPQFGVLMTQLMTSIKEHVAEEENDVFPQFRTKVGPEELKKLGATVEGLKKIVPTHPHPMSPDHPPFNALLGPGAGLVDRLRDMLTGRAKQ
jgi:hemerythrin superfamily protein